ncbi:hypothetical protein YC2023_096570 [Brassica napus]
MRMHWLRLPLQYQTRMVKGIASKWPGFSILYSTSKNIGPALAPIQAIPKITAGARPKHARKSSRNGKNFEAVVMLRLYSFARIKKMTNSFAHVLGKGGFGIVYKGKLPDGGRDIALFQKFLKMVMRLQASLTQVSLKDVLSHLAKTLYASLFPKKT